jgi:hypothetical protein
LVQIGDRLTGKREGEDELAIMARTWEFWAIAGATGLLLYVAALQGWLPRFVADYPFVLIPVAAAAGGFFGTMILIRKVHLQEAHPDHPYIRFNAFLARLILPIRYIFRLGHSKKGTGRRKVTSTRQVTAEDNTRKDNTK